MNELMNECCLICDGCEACLTLTWLFLLLLLLLLQAYRERATN